jgi:hypothetical protein
MSRNPGVNGKAFWRALAYCFKVVPKGDSNSALAHVVFLRDRIVAADGKRWHVGYLPSRLVKEPIAIARQSIKYLLRGLDYAYFMTGGKDGAFFVEHDGKALVIHYGDKKITHDLIESPVGEIPDEFTEPVPEDAPKLHDAALLCDASHLADAVERMTSWGVDHGLAELRGGDKGIVRVDVLTRTEDDDANERVGTAFILAKDSPPAVLPPNEPLLDGVVKDPGGQSVLSLRTDVFVADGREGGGGGEASGGGDGEVDPDADPDAAPSPSRGGKRKAAKATKKKGRRR